MKAGVAAWKVHRSLFFVREQLAGAPQPRSGLLFLLFTQAFKYALFYGDDGPTFAATLAAHN